MTANLLAALKSNQAKSCNITVNPLIEAAKNGQAENCERALNEPKIKVDQKDPDGVSALMHAAMGGHMDAVVFLVDRGARIAAKDDVGETALMKACKEGQIDVIQFLLDTQINQRKGKSIASFGTEGNQQKISAQEHKRILDAKDDEGITALMKAAESGEMETCKLLLTEGASADAKDDEHWNALLWASLAGQLEIVEMLIKDYGLQADYVTEKADTPLMKAASNGYWEVCEYLITEGAKINLHDQEYQTSLMWASAEGHIETVRGLLQLDAKTDVMTKQGRTALSLASQFGRFEVAKLLVETGNAKIDIQDNDGQTPTFYAVLSGSHELLDYLLEKKCDIEAHTKRGETALMWAAIHQQLDCVKLLLSRGADLHKQDENGQRALDHAEGTLNSHVVEALREVLKKNPKSAGED